MTNAIAARRSALPSICANQRAFPPLDRIVTRTSQVIIGEFRCPVEYPSFSNTGPTEHFIVVFPRSSVWIRHEGSEAFLTDPTMATIYNRGQVYERRAHSSAGDRCDWFGVCDDLAREIAAAFDERAGESDRPFAFEYASTGADLYYRQRALLAKARRGDLDALEIEEGVMATVAGVLRRAYQPERIEQPKSRRDVVDAARAELLRNVTRQMSLTEIATRVQASPFHLSRVFHATTGMTMSDYRNELRVRLSLEMLDSSVAPKRSISEMAYAMGFSSHAHYVSAVRRVIGTTPSAARALLSGSRVEG